MVACPGRGVALLALALAARGASGSACIHAASRCSWSEHPTCSPSLFDDSVKLTHELVIAHSKEDISWSDPYDAIRTVYTRPEITEARRPTASRVIELRNIGLEQYTCAHFAENGTADPRRPSCQHRWSHDADVVPGCSLLQTCATLSRITIRSPNAPCSCRASCRHAASSAPMA